MKGSTRRFASPAMSAFQPGAKNSKKKGISLRGSFLPGLHGRDAVDRDEDRYLERERHSRGPAEKRI